MPCYLYQASYTGAAIKTLVGNPQDRTGPARAVIEANRGTIIGTRMALGSDDLVVVADIPDDASMAGVTVAVSATGAIEGGKTTKLLDMPTAVEGMKKAKAVLDVYQPPNKKGGQALRMAPLRGLGSKRKRRANGI